jgi:hypothetical protein
MTPESLTRTVQDFLNEAWGAVVLENGAVMFDLAQAKYSISGEYNKCLLHLWSAERNTVRRVLDAEVKSGTLRLAVQRLGQALDFAADFRSGSGKILWADLCAGAHSPGTDRVRCAGSECFGDAEFD